MPDNSGRAARALPAANLVALLVTVALLWWRTAAVEGTVRDLTTAVQKLQVEVAVLHQVLQPAASSEARPWRR